MADLESNQIMPPSVEVCFFYRDNLLYRLPAFLLLNFIKKARPSAEDDNEYHRLAYWADDLPCDQMSEEIQALIEYMKHYTTWDDIKPFIRLGLDSIESIGELWASKNNHHNNYSVQLHHTKLPPVLYRYMPYNPLWLKAMFIDNQLYLPSPSQFNDPFDCSIDESVRLTFIECAIGCFSTEDDNILMFSHYSKNHEGICIGMNTAELARSMRDRNDNIKAVMRPVWYFNIMPDLDFKRQPALFAVCKHDVWSYENEYRLFTVRGSSPQPAGNYRFAPSAVESIVFGCKSSDECISTIKKMTTHLPGLRYFKACRDPNKFGVKLVEIIKL